MTLVPRVRIIHETNPEKYFPALFRLAERGQITLAGTHRYSVIKEWLRAGLRDKKPIVKRTRDAASDFALRLSLFRISGEVIVMGFAPWDFRLLFYRSLVRRNQILYHTSWADWHISNVPRLAGPLTPMLRRVWIGFLAHPNVRVISVTDSVADSLKVETGVSSTVIPHAVPEIFFDVAQGRARQSGMLRLIFVGEVSEQKGITDLLQVMQALPKLQVSLTIVGNGPLAAQLTSAKLAANITYLGPIHDRQKLAETMAECDLLMLLSQSELFGIVIVEAIAAGLGVIASDNIGPRTILSPVGGMGLFAQGDLAGVIKFIKKCLTDPAELEKIKKTQSSLAHRFAIEDICVEWLRAVKAREVEK